MAKREGIQKRLQRIRPPRVQLTYDVEIGDAIEQKELPFALGVIGDFSGTSKVAQPKLKDKKFISIDLDNFDEVMAGLSPSVNCRVSNTLTSQGGEFAVDMSFHAIDDFRPETVARKVEPLNKLLEARMKLTDLRNKLVGNEALEDILNQVLSNTDKLHAIGLESNEKEGS